MAVVKTHFKQRGKVGNAWAKDNVRYIQHRTGRDKERVMRPMFTSDGKHLVWGSNRNGKTEGETNVFIADWVDTK